MTHLRIPQLHLPRVINSPVLLVALAVSLALATGPPNTTQPITSQPSHAQTQSQSLTFEQSPPAASSGTSPAPNSVASSDDTTAPTQASPSEDTMSSWASPSTPYVGNATGTNQTLPSANPADSCLDSGSCLYAPTAPPPPPSNCTTCSATKSHEYRCLMMMCPEYY